MAKVKACKSYAFTQKFPKVENKEHLFNFIIYFYFLSLCFNAPPSSKASQSTSQKYLPLSGTCMTSFKHALSQT